MARIRNYAREYEHRIARGLARGLTRSQARGHPRAKEPAIRGMSTPDYDPQLELGIRGIRDGRSLTAMAHSLEVDPQRLANYAIGTGVVEKQGRRYVAIDDDRLREVTTYSGGAEHVVVLRGFAEAAKWGRYMAAVGQFLNTNDALVLMPFEDDVLTDVDGKVWPFEVRPNVLYRLTLTTEDPSRALYRIAVTN